MSKRAIETADDYPRVVVDFGDGRRVIECGAGIQWIVQKRMHDGSLDAYPWRGQYFCRTKEALLLYSGHGGHPTLQGLPDRFPEANVGQSSETVFDSQQPPDTGIGDKPVPEDPKWSQKWVSAADQGPFDRLRGDAILSTWKPTGNGEGMPDIPEFLRRT